MVKTRTVVQTRTHAQKYFQKLTKSINSLGSAVDEAGYEAMGFNRYSSEKKGKKSRKSEGDSPDFMQHGELMDFTISSAMSSNRNFDTDDNKFVHSTPLLSLQNINIPSAPFPPVCSYQPSPAACGKRKHAELKAAQMLAGSSSKIDMEGAHVLSMMKDGAEYHPNIDTAFNVRRGKNSLSLAINNPELFDSEEGDGGQPTTPWDSGIRALEEQTAHGVACGVSTPSQQKNFLSKVRNCVRLVDTEGLRDLLEAAEFSAQSYIASTGESQLSSVALGLANSISVSNLMSVYTPDVDRKSSGDSTPSPVHTNTKLNSATSVRRTPSTLVARSLNRVDKAEIPVIVEASNLNADEGLVVNICTLLVDHGASLAAVDGDGNSCLHIAAFRNFSRLGRFAITRGSPMTIFNTKGDAPLHIASRNGHKDFLKMLSELGMNFHLRNALSQAAIDIVGANHSTNTAMRRDLRKFLYSIEPRLRTLILYHNDCLEHVPRRPSDWEGPDRLVGIMKRLWNAKEFADYEIEISSNFEKATVEMLGRVHSADYIAFVNNLSKKVVQSEETSKLTSVPFTPHVQRFLRNDGETEELKNPDLCDTSFSPGTLNAARRAAGSVAHAVDRLLLGRNRNAFCVVRPPGHHAGYRGLLDGGSSCGFCIFNSVAAGAFHALEEHNCERVAIIDLDIHHGKQY